MRELATMRDAMDRLWEGGHFWPFRVIAASGEAAVPTVDLYETPEEVVVKATLPGVKPEDLDINITGNALTIKGETKEEHEIKEGKYYRKECYYGDFVSSLTMPSGLKTDKAEASLENGLLTLTIPKAEEIKPKAIKVKSKQLAEGKKVENKS
jgi:HSP20 family protein